MPTHDPALRLTLEQALDLAEALTFPATSGAGLKVGIEPERFLFELDADGLPRRLPLQGSGGVLETLDRASGTDPRLLPRDPAVQPALIGLPQGGSLTFEPGAQVEHSTAVHENMSAALDDAASVGAAIADAFKGRPVQAVSLGLDPWSTARDVPQQLDAPRYHAMANYLAQRGPAGAQMMRLSCSLQVNLDLGQGAEREERVLLGFLLSPLIVSAFSTSPNLPGAARFHSRRARVWQTIDPTRSGFPRGLIEHPEQSIAKSYAQAALEADMLLLRDGAGGALPGKPGASFAQWIQRPHPALGYPTEDDLRYHLTTLFFEVRVRGFLELRGMDALPERWRAAGIGFAAGLLLDGQARQQALARLEGWRRRIEDLWWRSAELGFQDAELALATRELYELALEGLARLGPGFVRAEHFLQASRFYERFTSRSLAPADELREVFTAGPQKTLHWLEHDCELASDAARVDCAVN